MNHDNDDYIFDHNNDMVNDYCHNGDKDDGDNDSKWLNLDNPCYILGLIIIVTDVGLVEIAYFK